MTALDKLWPLGIVIVGMAVLLHLAGCVSAPVEQHGPEDMPAVYDSPPEDVEIACGCVDEAVEAGQIEDQGSDE